MRRKTGIRVYRGRVQPYTVWFRGMIVGFCHTLKEAEARLNDEMALYVNTVLCR